MTIPKKYLKCDKRFLAFYLYHCNFKKSVTLKLSADLVSELLKERDKSKELTDYVGSLFEVFDGIHVKLLDNSLWFSWFSRISYNAENDLFEFSQPEHPELGKAIMKTARDKLHNLFIERNDPIYIKHTIGTNNTNG